jgi:hypothetical protein
MNPGQYGAPPQGPPYGAPQGAPQQPQHYQQPQPQPPQHYGSSSATPTPPGKVGFFKGLLDLSFSTLVTTSVIKVLYVLLVVIAALAAIAMFGSGVMAIIKAIEYEVWSPFFTGLGMMIVSPFAFILYVIAARIYMELLMVIFRIAEDIRELNKKTRG